MAKHVAPSQLTVIGDRGTVAAKCPKQYIACFTYSLASGLVINWCYGPSSSPCSQTNTLTWSGEAGHYNAKTKVFKASKAIVATWTGPFQCAPSKCTGYYEVDTLTNGKKPPKQTKSYSWAQDIHYCAGTSCADAYIGLLIGP